MESLILIILAILGALVVWFVLGYLFERILQHFWSRGGRRRPILLWVEISIVYGPIGIAVGLWEELSKAAVHRPSYPCRE